MSSVVSMLRRERLSVFKMEERLKFFFTGRGVRGQLRVL
jgi:hypothetical protein